MLTLTDNATIEIRNLLEAPAAPDGSGVRIAADPTSGGLSLSLAAEPLDGDQVLDEEGARVFLEPQVATLLDDKSLDASVTDGGGVQFMLGDRI